MFSQLETQPKILMSLANGSDQKLDILIDQVGRLTEGLTEIRVTIQDQAEITRRQSESIDRQSASIDRLFEGMDELKIMVREQSEATKRLVGVSERQAATLDRQTESIDRQVQTTDRLARIVETLIQRQSE